MNNKTVNPDPFVSDIPIYFSLAPDPTRWEAVMIVVVMTDRMYSSRSWVKLSVMIWSIYTHDNISMNILIAMDLYLVKLEVRIPLMSSPRLRGLGQVPRRV